VANYHLKAYPREHFFVHFPEHNWPTDFLAKVAEERGKAPTSAWLHKPAHVELLHRTVGEQIAVYFGKRIYDVARTCRSFIISSLNPHWVEAADLPSGHTRSDLNASLVKALWKPDCHRRAVGSVMKSVARAFQSLTLAQKLHAVEASRNKNMEAGDREWGTSWRPLQWLTWVLVGLPCAENEGFVMDTLAVGRPGTQNATTDALQSTQQRRADRRAGGGGRTGADREETTGGARADMSVRHELHIVHERPVTVPPTERQFKLRRLQQQSKILTDLMVCLRQMGQRETVLMKLEHCQEQYMRVTDDMFAISEEAKENAHVKIMRESELVALLTDPREEPFRALRPSAASTHGRSSDIPTSPTTL
ncbi:hypothetical protein B484DRAFT_473005, partial [Ochromonadaceae sp. CCMP2298]